jgi:hypothetical protein
LGESISGKLIAVQGCGQVRASSNITHFWFHLEQVGLPLCRYLIAEGARVIVSESSAQRAADVGDELQQLGVELRTAPFGDNSIL